MITITRENLQRWADSYSDDDSAEYKQLRKKVANQKHLTRADLIDIGRWKSPRPTKHYESNSEGDVRAITEISFDTKNERARIGILLSLHGVSFPLASTILHFKFPNHYPILDFRALWSLGWKKPSSYRFEFWQAYCEEIWRIKKQTGLNIRTIDKALWQFSKEKQKP